MTQMTMTTDQHVHVDGHATCPCGQELDTCRRSHCPRCGHRIPATAGRVG